MLKAIQNNPYRILGVFTNSPKKEQIANKGKLSAFIRINKKMSFPLDLVKYIPKCIRTQELLDFAESELSLSEGKRKHAQFWFVNKTPIDNIAFNHLFDGNIEKAIDLWSKSENMSSLQNRFVCMLIIGDYQSAIEKYAIPLYSHFYQELVSGTEQRLTTASTQLIQYIVDVLTEENVDLLRISAKINNNDWISIIESSRVKPLISKINALVADVKSINAKDSEKKLKAGIRLKSECDTILTSLCNIITFQNTKYQLIADKVANEILQCAIDYYNESKELESPAKALPLCEYAKNIAAGKTIKERCEENYKVIKEAYEKLPPKEVICETNEIKSIIKKYSKQYDKQKKMSKNGLNLLREARIPLMEIKEKLGKSHKYYLEISSLLGSVALDYVIGEVNEFQESEEREKKTWEIEFLKKHSNYSPFSYEWNKFLEEMNDYKQKCKSREFFPYFIIGYYKFFPCHTYEEEMKKYEKRKTQKIKRLFRDAWRTILYIDLLDKTNDFLKNRYNPNRNTLHKIINDLHGFAQPDEYYIIRGCAYNLSADKKFFLSDSELFASCKNKEDYKMYLSSFPKGRHVERANIKLIEIEKRDKNIKLIIIYVIISILLSFILAIIH